MQDWQPTPNLGAILVGVGCFVTWEVQRPSW